MNMGNSVLELTALENFKGSMKTKPEIISRVRRMTPRSEIRDGMKSISYPDGFSYSVKMSDNVVREVFVSHGPDSTKINYENLKFVSRPSEGDSFYKSSRRERFTNESVTPDLKDAIIAFDNNPLVSKKNINLNGGSTPEAPVARLGVIQAAKLAQ